MEMNSAVSELFYGRVRTNQRWVGIESERFLVSGKKQVLHYDSGIDELLRDLVKSAGWEVLNSFAGKPLALSKEQHQLTLEPGAQVEISPAHQAELYRLRELEQAIETSVLQTHTAQTWKWLCLGLNPWESVEDIEVLPSPRYQLMTDYFPQKGRRGLEMMRLTSGIHVNVDFSSIDEGEENFQVANYVAPFVAALFCNSPYRESRQTGYLSERIKIWEETDELRSGFQDFYLDPSFSLQDYVNFVERLPLMYYTDEKDQTRDPKGRSLSQLSPEMQETNALAAVRQVFTEVRLKPCCVEFRCLDQQEPQNRYAATAFVLGLLYNDWSRKKLQERAVRCGAKALRQILSEAAQTGISRNDIYKEVGSLLSLAEEGLISRGYQEQKLLEPAWDLYKKKETPAERVLKRADLV